ncbi:MAG: hypothetical protein CMH28_08265 [Micavibrio sp.]|nr:hypothetical protein [Micavibrio sp.]
MKTFAGFVAAGAYDKICNEGKLTTQPPDKSNLYWYGNQNAIVALLAAPMRRRFPQDTVEDGVARLVKLREVISAKSRDVLKAEGCDSAKAQHMAKGLKLFTTVPPWKIHALIEKDVAAQGGEMTILTEEEEKVSPPD